MIDYFVCFRLFKLVSQRTIFIISVLCYFHYFGLVLVLVWTFNLIWVHDNPLVIV